LGWPVWNGIWWPLLPKYTPLDPDDDIASILYIISKISEPESNWGNWFHKLNSEKEEILMNQFTKDKTRSSLFSILTKDEETINLLGEISGLKNLKDLIEKGKRAVEEEKRKDANFDHKKKIGTYIEDLIRNSLELTISGLKFNYVDEDKLATKEQQGGQDIIITLNDREIYYIEVKSRWDPSSVVSMSKLQLEKASKHPKNYALCSVDMTEYSGAEDKYKVSSVEIIMPFIKFVEGIGGDIKPLIELNLRAEQDNQKNITLTDYRGTVPQSIIKLGIGMKEFVKELTSYIQEEMQLPST
jgi:hypothetical protein